MKGKSGVGTEPESEVEVSVPSSERIVALLYCSIIVALFGLCTFLSIFMLPICCCIIGGLYSL